MNSIYKNLVAISLSLMIAVPAFAGNSAKHRYCDQDRGASIERRLERQYYRIEQGIDRESLTYKETKKLKSKHRHIRRLSREFKEDGLLSHKEFKRLNRKLDRLSNLIREFKHNDLVRFVKYHDNYSHKISYGSDWR